MRQLLQQIKKLYQQLVKIKEQRNQQKDSLSFLPSALEIEQRPPHPAAKMMLWLVLTFFVVALLWACFGKVDVIVVGSGKIVPQAHVKAIQPLEKGIIKAILVKDGQLVKKGEILIELDQRVTQTDIDNIAHQLKMAQLMLVQNQSLYYLLGLPQNTLIDESTIHRSLNVKGLDEDEKKALNELIWRKWQAYTAQINYLNAAIDAANAEHEATKTQMEMLRRMLPIIKEQNNMYRSLHENKYASKMEWLQSQKDLIEKEHTLSRLEAIMAQSKANMAAQLSALKRTKADYLAQVLEQIETRKKEVNVLAKVMEKYDLMQETQNLTAPITGFVLGLSVNTIGAIVTPAQVLMHVVPKDSLLEVNANIANKDIGYVHEGQKVEVKVDTYPFTEYGLLTGKVMELSDDAIEDGKLGMVFKTTIALDGERLYKGGQEFSIRSGMTVSVEVKMGERRIIEYFLSPLTKAFKESLHER